MNDAPGQHIERAAEYRLTAEAVLADPGSDPKRGLGSHEARARLERYGYNELEAEKPVPAWRRFLAQFRDTLVILLLVATAISFGLWAYERDSAPPTKGSPSSRSCASFQPSRLWAPQPSSPRTRPAPSRRTR